MGTLLYKLHDVPDAEATEIRQILNDASIAFYETTAGNWGVSLAAVWLVDESDLPRAKELLDAFQETWREQQLQDIPEPFLQRVFRQPLKFALAMVAVLTILYLSIAPFTGAWS